MKKFFVVLLALVLAFGTVQTALASEGDATIWHVDNSNGYSDESLQSGAYLVGNKVYFQTYESAQGDVMHVYDLGTHEDKTYSMKNIYEPGDYGLISSEEAQKNGYVNYSGVSPIAVFAYQGELCQVLSFSSYTENSSTIDSGHVYKLVLDGEEAHLEPSGISDLDWTSLIEVYDTYSYARNLDTSFADDAYLYGTTYDNEGNNLLVSFDLATGKCTEHYIQDLYSAVPTGEPGKVLVSTFNWSDEDGTVTFLIYDVVSQTAEEKASTSFMIGGLGYTPSNLCYNAGTDTLFYTLGGELWRAEHFDTDNAVSVNDVPAGSSGYVSQMTDDGYMLLCDYSTIVLRSTDPDKRSAVTLRVSDSTYVSAMDNAYYDFTNAHGDMSVIINRNGQSSGVLQDMMNRSGETDIYIMQIESSEYSALFERGYIAELDGSAKLTEAVEAMYPGIKNVVSKDGKVYALPVSMYGSSIGYNPSALEKLGMTQDDLPKTWDELFDFIAKAGELAENSGEVRVFESYYARNDIKRMLFDVIFTDYQGYLNAGDVQYAFNTPLMRGLMARLEEIDYDQLGVLEQVYDEETDTWYDNWDGRESLLESYTNLAIQNFSGGYEPLMLSFEGEAPRATVRLSAAFINPFSEHREEAAQLLEVLLDDLDLVTKYNFYDSMNEPVRYPDFEEYKKNMADWLEEAKEALETCEEDEKEMYQENIDYIENELANIDDTYWMISPKDIEAYRARAQYLCPMTYDCTSVDVGEEGDDTLWSMINKYYDGLMTADEMLAAVDKKVQMMRLEGM